MNNSIIGLAVIISFCAMSSKGCSDAGSEGIRRVRFTYQMPLRNWSSEVQDRVDSYDVYYNEPMIMYKFSFIYDSMADGKIVKEEKRVNYFVFDRDSGYGRSYDPKDPVFSGQRLSRDSVLAARTFENSLFDTLATSKPDSLYTSPVGDLVRVYSMAGKGKTAINYTIYCWYTDKLKGIAETFSAKLDNDSKRKLYKISGVPDRPYLPGYPVNEIVYEMKEVEVGEKELAAGYFKAYRADRK